ncbi:DNA processing protein [Laceyella sediminis]|uniref:DNA processing protein n=2 Tax=Laceyella sediminis TaxID=573074 RepID=A0ABX5EMH3_9BACL|nr:DNA processing protein [Laceyella sediminis]
MTCMEKRECCIILSQVEGIGWQTVDRFMRLVGKPTHVSVGEMLDILRVLGVAERVVDRAKACAYLLSQQVEAWAADGIEVITRFDEAYPLYLTEIAQPPWVLFCKGDRSLLGEPSVAVVGTRKPTPYGLRVTRMLAQALAEQGLVVTSGMANGIDGEAHRAVLKSTGRTIAVLGAGIDVIYPKNHRTLYQELTSRGLVVSEMPPGTPPHPGLFPRRNRIISGLSLGTLVVEAAERSGSLITADFSMEQGREVFAVPGPITTTQSQGTLKLIQQGAKCVRSVEDILEEIPFVAYNQAVQQDTVTASDLTEAEQWLLERVAPDRPVSIDQIMGLSGTKWEFGQIHQSLLSLELKGMIASMPGGQYIRK